MTTESAALPSQRQICVCFAYLAYIGAVRQSSSGSPYQLTDDEIFTELNNLMSKNPGPIVPPPSYPQYKPVPLWPIAGEWEIVWGPATYTVPGARFQDNMMYVVRLTSPKPGQPHQYVIANRGTNGAVLLDWLMEDFDIQQFMPWKTGLDGPPAGASISEATNIGLTILTGLKPQGSTVKQQGTTLYDFLESEMAGSSEPASICVTGHSKGGALAPTLALFLRDTQLSWDPSSRATVTTISFAGPTAGNEAFAEYSDSRFRIPPENPLEGLWTGESFCDPVRTTLDIAPFAWNQLTYDDLENLYAGHLLDSIKLGIVLSEVLKKVGPMLSSLGYKQIMDGAAKLDCKFAYPRKSSKSPNLKNYFSANSKVPEYLQEALYQHHCSYPTALGVDNILEILPMSSPTEAN